MKYIKDNRDIGHISYETLIVNEGSNYIKKTMTMEILSNFVSIYCLITFIVGAVFMLAMYSIAAIGKKKEPKNKVHFYVARDNDKSLWLYLGKPIKVAHMFVKGHGRALVSSHGFQEFGLNEHDFDNLKWEDEPMEVFINVED